MRIFRFYTLFLAGLIEISPLFRFVSAIQGIFLLPGITVFLRKFFRGAFYSVFLLYISPEHRRVYDV